jgi:hypothetical protein
MAALPAETASAQNLLESLFGGRTASAPAPTNAGTASPNAWDFIDKATPKSSTRSGPANSYCVRLCDGRFFPLPRKTVSAQMSSAQACSAMCPAAETRVFAGSAIERAVGTGGEAYAAL